MPLLELCMQSESQTPDRQKPSLCEQSANGRRQSLQAEQVPFDGKDMVVVSVHVPQRLGQLQQIIPVAAAGALAGGDVTGNQQFVGLAEKSGIVLGGNIDQTVRLIPVGKSQWSAKAQVTIFLPMVEMLERLHRLKSAGRSISVVAFNGAKDEDQYTRFADLPGQEPHESAQAENIRSAAEAGDFDHVVVLVGNLHASKKPINFGGPQWRPMAMILAESADVLTLNMAYSGGSSWSCQLADGVVREPGKPISSDQIECKARPLVDAPAYGERQFRLDRETDPRYDGLYVLGEISASPPFGQQ